MEKFMLYHGDEKIGEAESCSISGQFWEYYMKRNGYYYFRTLFSRARIKPVNELDLKYGDLVQLEISDK